MEYFYHSTGSSVSLHLFQLFGAGKGAAFSFFLCFLGQLPGPSGHIHQGIVVGYTLSDGMKLFESLSFWGGAYVLSGLGQRLGPSGHPHPIAAKRLLLTGESVFCDELAHACSLESKNKLASIKMNRNFVMYGAPSG